MPRSTLRVDTNFARVVDEISNLSDDGIISMQEALRINTISPNPIPDGVDFARYFWEPVSWGPVSPARPNQRQIRYCIRKQKRKEKPLVLEFLHTGVTDGNMLYAIFDKMHQLLALVGKDIEGQQVVFILQNGKIVANQNRSNHIRKELEAFATLQGYEIEFVEYFLACDGGELSMIYRWPKRQEVDDSELLVTKVREPSLINSGSAESGQADGPRCDCGDCRSAQADDMPF